MGQTATQFHIIGSTIVMKKISGKVFSRLNIVEKNESITVTGYKGKQMTLSWVNEKHAYWEAEDWDIFETQYTTIYKWKKIQSVAQQGEPSSAKKRAVDNTL